MKFFLVIYELLVRMDVTGVTDAHFQPAGLMEREGR